MRQRPVHQNPVTSAKMRIWCPENGTSRDVPLLANTDALRVSGAFLTAPAEFQRCVHEEETGRILVFRGKTFIGHVPDEDCHASRLFCRLVEAGVNAAQAAHNSGLSFHSPMSLPPKSEDA